MLIFAQSIGEYGGAGGGIAGAMERAVTNASAAIQGSMADHTAFWIVGACVAVWLLFRRS
jgi:hypothetical protein